MTTPAEDLAAATGTLIRSLGNDPVTNSVPCVDAMIDLDDFDRDPSGRNESSMVRSAEDLIDQVSISCPASPELTDAKSSLEAYLATFAA